ncbi:hypothetical protein AAF712_002211, partial [Marasmius tenuissimus]
TSASGRSLSETYWSWSFPMLLLELLAGMVVVVGSPIPPYLLPTSLPFPFPSSSLPTLPTMFRYVLLDLKPSLRGNAAPFPANQDDSLWPAAGEYKTGLGLTFKDADSDIARRLNMVALHTIVYDMDDDFFDFAPPRAGHFEGVEFEEELLDDVADPSLGYWDAMGESEREFTWRTEYGDDSWLFDRPLYTEVEEKKSVWRRIRSGLKKKVLRRHF